MRLKVQQDLIVNEKCKNNNSVKFRYILSEKIASKHLTDGKF